MAEVLEKKEMDMSGIPMEMDGIKDLTKATNEARRKPEERAKAVRKRVEGKIRKRKQEGLWNSYPRSEPNEKP